MWNTRCTYTSQSVCTLVTFYNKRIRKYLREVLNECSIAIVFWGIPKHRVCIPVRVRVGPRVKVELMSHALFLNWDHTFIVSYGKTSRLRWNYRALPCLKMGHALFLNLDHKFLFLMEKLVVFAEREVLQLCTSLVPDSWRGAVHSLYSASP